MKKIISFLILISMSLFMFGCADRKNSNEETDYPIKVVKGAFGEQYEKRPIKMINIDGELYYDTGLKSELTARCGTLDRVLKNTKKEYEIPLNSGEANFDAKGCQSFSSIAKEVNTGDGWIVFKKYEALPQNLENFKYCFYIKGRLNSALIDSEIVVLTDNKDITFSDVYEPMLSSSRPICEGPSYISHNMFLSGDEWGISLTADNITPVGLTLKCEQFGGTPTGELQTGASFSLERNANDKWESVPTNPIDYAWNMVAYSINRNEITEFEVDWKWLYGELEPGSYCLNKEIMDFRETGDYDIKTYKLYFSIEE